MSKSEVIARDQAATEDRWPSLRDFPVLAEPVNNATTLIKVTDGVEHHAEPEVRDVEPEVLPLADVAAGQTTDVQPVERVPQATDPYAALQAAVNALELARAEARKCRTATVGARAAFAKALERWNHSQPIMTQEQQAREFIATSNADRARKAAAGHGIVHAGVTRTARAYAQGNQQRGGGRAYVRGPDGTKAFSKAEAMTLEANRLRAAAAAAIKPPGDQK